MMLTYLIMSIFISSITTIETKIQSGDDFLGGIILTDDNVSHRNGQTQITCDFLALIEHRSNETEQGDICPTKEEVVRQMTVHQWDKDGVPLLNLRDDFHFITLRNVLALPSTNTDNSGAYTCHVKYYNESETLLDCYNIYHNATLVYKPSDELSSDDSPTDSTILNDTTCNSQSSDDALALIHVNNLKEFVQDIGLSIEGSTKLECINIFVILAVSLHLLIRDVWSFFTPKNSMKESLHRINRLEEETESTNAKGTLKTVVDFGGKHHTNRTCCIGK